MPVEDQAFGNGVLVDWWDSHRVSKVRSGTVEQAGRRRYGSWMYVIMCIQVSDRGPSHNSCLQSVGLSTPLYRAPISDNETWPLHLAAASSSLIHPFIAPIRSLPTRLSLLFCLLTVCHSPHLLYQSAFTSAASLVHLFHREHFISFVAFAFVRSIAASSPHSTFATP